MPKLVVKEPNRTWLVDLRPGETLLVGRATRCDVTIDAPRASRKHCEIAVAGDGHAVRDLGSTNGTTHNGEAVTGDVPLGDGDRVDAAGCVLVYWSRP